ncbi:MAG: helix-turn-helix transcriptional regulator [Clostridiales bacterium]|nr:helix-turn-helix transcriptional regulator [Clostridiales bacterium]
MDLVTKSKRPGMPGAIDVFFDKSSGFSQYVNDRTTYKLLLIDEGSFVVEDEGQYRAIAAPAGIMLNEKADLKIVSEEGVKSRTIYFRPSIIREEFTIEAMNSGKYDKFYSVIDNDEAKKDKPSSFAEGKDDARRSNLPHEECFMKEMAYQDALLLLDFCRNGMDAVYFSLSRQEYDALDRHFFSIEYELEHQWDNYWILRTRFFIISILFMPTADLYYCNNRQVEIYKDPLVAKVTRYFWVNMGGEITLQDVLTKFSINKNQLNDAFNAEVGMSCMNYLENLRVNWAKKTLQFSDETISEISMRCGYTDTNYFTKVFKKHTGMTPSEFRKNVRDLA